MAGRVGRRWQSAVATPLVPALLAMALLVSGPAAVGQVDLGDIVPSGTDGCPDTTALTVPGADFHQATCLEDLTTLSNQRIDPFTYGWGGSGNRGNPTINSTATSYSDTPVPGVQIEGWFDDTCSHYEVEHNTFIPTCDNGMRRNGQFVMRLPNDWDGQHLVVAGGPGIRTQFASDIILSDFVLGMGWAYVAQDKGNTGLNFFRTGDDEVGEDPLRWEPPVAIEQWAIAMRRAAVAGQGVLRQLGGSEAPLTYAAGISNGGYQTRLALERYPELFDGGVDWEGTLFTADGPSVYTWIPPLLRGYPAFAATGDLEGYRTMVHDGLVAPDSQPIWEDHYAIYWGAVASTYRPVVDPEYSNYLDAPQLVVPPDHPDATYDYAARPSFVRDRVARLSNTGDTHGLPLITLHGTLDALLPIAGDSDVYSQMVRDQGHGEDYRYYVVEGGTHVDTAADDFPDTFRPILPCFWESLTALDAWVQDGQPAPPSGFIEFPTEQTPVERANTCDLPDRTDRIAGPNRVATAAEAARHTFGVTQRVVIASAGSFADALAAAPLAATTDSPVLLVGATLDESVRRELARTGAVEAVIVGGPAVVGEGIVTELAALDLHVRRLAGGDRFATAAAVAAEVGASAGLAYIASGRSFADALSASAVAASLGTPILLTEADMIPSATAAALTSLGVSRTVVVGGSSAISSTVLDDLPDPQRVSGGNRYATSVAVVEHGMSAGLALDQLYVATGAGFADALAAAPVAAAGEWGAAPKGMVLLIDGDRRDGSLEVLDFLADHAADIDRVVLFGGEAAISRAVHAAVRTALG